MGADRTQTALAGVAGRGLGDSQAVIDDTNLDPDVVVASEQAATIAAFRVTSVDGADETTPPNEIYAVLGMSATSVVVGVLHVSTKASVATIENVDPALFTPGTDTLTSLTEVDRSNDQLLIFWFDV